VSERAACGILIAVLCRVLKLPRQPYYRWLVDPVTESALVEVGNVMHVFIRPHCPWQIGKIERLNRTLAPWLEHHNNERSHSALGGLPPASRLST